MSLVQKLAELDADRIASIELFKQINTGSRKALDILLSLKEPQRLYLQKTALEESTTDVESEINEKLIKLLNLIEGFDVLIQNYNIQKDICLPKILEIIPEPESESE
jgi:hypothetical protein